MNYKTYLSTQNESLTAFINTILHHHK